MSPRPSLPLGKGRGKVEKGDAFTTANAAAATHAGLTWRRIGIYAQLLTLSFSQRTPPKVAISKAFDSFSSRHSVYFLLLHPPVITFLQVHKYVLPFFAFVRTPSTMSSRRSQWARVPRPHMQTMPQHSPAPSI